MKINIVNEGVVMIRVSHRASECDFSPKVLWKRLGSTNKDAVYGALNEYLATLSMETQDALYGLYIECSELIESDYTMDVVKIGLTDIVKRLFETIDYDHLTDWVMTYGNIGYNADIHEEYTDNYPITKRLTYLKKEFDALVVLSFLFKLVTPIWGGFLKTYANIDTDLKELEALALMETSNVHEIPAMIRLKDYCEASTERHREKGLSPSICTGMGTSEIPIYYLALAIVRRIAVSEMRDPDKTIIKIVYKFLESRSKSLSNGVRDKRGSKVDIEETESIGERYRISQQVPDYAIQMSSVYVMQVKGMVKSLNPKGSINKAKGYIKLLLASPDFSIANFHFIISALVTDRAVPIRNLRIMEREPLIHVIGIASGWLSDNGHQPLANMLMAGKSEKDADRVDIYAAGGLSFEPLTEDNLKRLESIYPYRRQEYNGKPTLCQGIAMLNEIITEVNEYIWVDHDNVPSNLRNIITELLFLREKRIKELKHELKQSS